MFPGAAQRIHELKASSAHFARLAEEYHVVNRAIHRAETDIEPTDDANMIELRRRRLKLLDEVGAIIRAA